jgi:Ni,Fe-hydrogenase III large subunit
VARGNEVEKPIGEIQSDVDDLCNSFREGRVLIERASAIAMLTQKKTESAKWELGRMVRIEAGVSLVRIAPVVPMPGLESTQQLADA